jgi:hypothetical protein
MGLLDKVKSQTEAVAAKAKEGVHEVQLKRELGQAHEELGKLAFELAEAGELAHARLAPLLDKVRDLKAQLAEHGEGEPEPEPVPPAETRPPAEPGPPAMPN